MLPLLHVTGLVGAGKTTTIRCLFPEVKAFDIADIYRAHGITPPDFRDPEKYKTFERILTIAFEEYRQTAEKTAQPFMIVESSGVNPLLNRLIDPYSPVTLWIVPDPSRINDPTLLTARPHAEKFNAMIWAQYNDGLFVPDITYNPISREIMGTLPPWLEPWFPKSVKKN
jgi:hypothetical protein